MKFLCLLFLFSLIISCNKKSEDATEKSSQHKEIKSSNTTEFKPFDLGVEAPNFSLKGADTNTYQLTDFKGKYVVLEWTNYTCPFVNKHYSTGSIQKIQSDFIKQGAVWLSICSSSQGSAGYFDKSQLNAEIKKKQSNCTAYLIDDQGTMAKAYGAKTTPYILILDQQHKLIYKGAIDDIRSIDTDDIDKAKNYLTMALSAIKAGKPIDPASTRPYGCSLKLK